MVTSFPVYSDPCGRNLHSVCTGSKNSAHNVETVEDERQTSVEHKLNTLVSLSNGDITSCLNCFWQPKSTFSHYERSKHACHFRVVHPRRETCVEPKRKQWSHYQPVTLLPVKNAFWRPKSIIRHYWPIKRAYILLRPIKDSHETCADHLK
jgi:hypothetical protein